jgi:hypothetical protein
MPAEMWTEKEFENLEASFGEKLNFTGLLDFQLTLLRVLSCANPKSYPNFNQDALDTHSSESVCRFLVHIYLNDSFPTTYVRPM